MALREDREGRGGERLLCLVYIHPSLPHPTTQSAGYQEDFNEERKDREKAHSKIADMEIQYKQQFNKLGEELMVSRQHCEQLERRLKEVERLKEEASKLQLARQEVRVHIGLHVVKVRGQ